MEEKTLDQGAFLLEKFKTQGDFLIFGEEKLKTMVAALIEADAAYQKAAGVDQGEVYDDDAAYEFLHNALGARFPEDKMYLMRLCDDFLDYNEEYLEQAGLIEWE